jgi:hypothetical protein
MPHCRVFLDKKQRGRIMSIADFIITVFCIIDEELKKCWMARNDESEEGIPF